MLLRGTGFYIWVILGVVCTIACLSECGSCPLEGIGFLNTYPSYLGLDYGPGCEHKVPVVENVSYSSKLMIPEWMVQSLNYLDGDRSITSVYESKYQANQGQLFCDNFSCVWLIIKCPSVILMPKCRMSNTTMQGNMESLRSIGQSNMSGIYVLDDHDPFSPLVSLNIYFAKSIALKYMIQQPWSSNLIHHDSTDTSRSGFFMVVNPLTQAFLHPYDTASPGPILSHHSNHCEWKTKSLVMPSINLHLNMSLPCSLSRSYPINSHFIEEASFGLMVKRDFNFKQASGISISMLNLCIGMVLAAVLMFLLFRLIMPQIILSHSVDYSIKGDRRSIQVVRPKQKSSTVHLSQRNRKSVKSTKMAHFKAVQRDESSFSPSLVSKPVIIDSNGGKFEESPPVSSTVRTRKDKRKRPRKKNGVTSGIIAHMEVLNHDGNSKTTSSLSLEESLFHDSSSLFIRDTIVTFSGLERSALDPPISAPSRLAISSLSRAPGPRSKTQKAVQAEERGDYEDRFRYDIWGDHFSRIGLMCRPDGSFASLSEPMEGVSHSFFVSDPLQTLMRNSGPAPAPVTAD
ncbi:uncharacterized protein LOC141623209 [Silene latifolia]|uniref:uncharacterized protein LOC141623209 n=1 Tax=Silene latifolia TaxID=37657 RepID=UPI003D784726